MYDRVALAPRFTAPRALPAPTAATSLGVLPLNADLVLYRGDDFYLDVTVTDGTGAAFDLSGYTAAAQIRATADAADPPLATFTATIAGNVIGLHLDDTDAAKLPSSCAWDVQITSSADDVTTLAYGKVSVTLDVTRP